MKNILGVLLITLILGAVTLSQSLAEIGGTKTRGIETQEIFPDSESFLIAKGDIYKVATDGCNIGQIIDGRLGGMTEMWCEDVYGPNGKEQWSCREYLKTTQPNLGDMRICTMEYAPVCGVDGVTYGNACGAGDAEIAYKGECEGLVNLSRLNRLNRVYETRFTEVVAQVSVDQRIRALEVIEQRIEAVKRSRIATWVQEVRITELVFFRNIFQNAPYSE